MAHSRKTKLYLFDFDLTQTREETDDFDYEMTDEEVKANIKKHLGECFRAILAAEHKLYIVTRNPEPELVKRHLQAAGLTDEELKQIIIKCPKHCKTGDKTRWVIDCIIESFEIDEINYYDDDENYLERAKAEFIKHAWTTKSLNTFLIPLEEDYNDHFLTIITELKGQSYSGKLFNSTSAETKAAEFNKERASLSEATTDSSDSPSTQPASSGTTPPSPISHKF